MRPFFVFFFAVGFSQRNKWRSEQGFSRNCLFLLAKALCFCI